MATSPSSGLDRPGTPDRWLMLAMVALNYFVLYLHRNLMNYVQPPLKADLGLTKVDLGVLRSAFLVTYCVMQLCVGYLSDRYRRRSVILVSLVISSLALAGMGFARGFEELLFLRIVLAIGQSAAVPAMASTIADCFSPHTRAKAVGIYLVSYNFSLVIAGKYGGRVADIPIWRVPLGPFGGELEIAGWRMAHFLFAGVGCLAALILLVLFREPERTERVAGVGLGAGGARVWTTVASVFRTPAFVVIALVFSLTGGVISACQFWLPPYFGEKFDLNLSKAGFFATIWIQSGTIAGLLAGGLLADRWARRFMAGRTAVQIIGTGAMIPTILIIGAGESQWLLAAAMTVFGLGVGLYQSNLWTTTFEVVDPAARATAVGLLNLASGVLVSTWADPAIGWIQERDGLRHVFPGMSLVVALSLGLLLVNWKLLLPRDYRGPLATLGRERK